MNRETIELAMKNRPNHDFETSKFLAEVREDMDSLKNEIEQSRLAMNKKSTRRRFTEVQTRVKIFSGTGGNLEEKINEFLAYSLYKYGKNARVKDIKFIATESQDKALVIIESEI